MEIIYKKDKLDNENLCNENKIDVINNKNNIDNFGNELLHFLMARLDYTPHFVVL